MIILDCDTLAQRHGAPLAHAAYFSALTGPAPLMSLRTVLATLNGLAYAYNTPRIALPTLPTLVEKLREQADNVCVLLNAFCGDRYYAAYSTHGGYEQGCAREETVQGWLTTWHMHAQGTRIYCCDALSMPLSEQYYDAHSTSILSDAPSLGYTLMRAHEAYMRGDSTALLEPVYLKAAV